MPNCFQLLRDGSAVSLAEVDEEMCRDLGAACDPVRYFSSWFDIIGRKLAMGRDWDEVRSSLDDDYSESPVLVQILDWLQSRFTVRSWYEQRGHPRD